MSELFAKVTSLPKVFNAADSRSEDHCLRGAFTHACESVVRCTQPIQRSGGVLRRGIGTEYGQIDLSLADRPEASRVGIDRAAVTNAYKIWSREAAAAFGRAIAVVIASGAIVNGQDATAEMIYILDKYGESLANRPVKLGNRAIARLEESLWDLRLAGR